jgi:hypothetical protein
MPACPKPHARLLFCPAAYLPDCLPACPPGDVPPLLLRLSRKRAHVFATLTVFKIKFQVKQTREVRYIKRNSEVHDWKSAKHRLET